MGNAPAADAALPPAPSDAPSAAPDTTTAPTATPVTNAKADSVPRTPAAHGTEVVTLQFAGLHIGMPTDLAQLPFHGTDVDMREGVGKIAGGFTSVPSTDI